MVHDGGCIMVTESPRVFIAAGSGRPSEVRQQRDHDQARRISSLDPSPVTTHQDLSAKNGLAPILGYSLLLRPLLIRGVQTSKAMST